MRLNEEHKQVTEEKDAAIALLNDDLQNREYENVDCKHKETYMKPKFVALLSIVMFLVQKIQVKATLL